MRKEIDQIVKTPREVAIAYLSELEKRNRILEKLRGKADWSELYAKRLRKYEPGYREFIMRPRRDSNLDAAIEVIRGRFVSTGKEDIFETPVKPNKPTRDRANMLR